MTKSITYYLFSNCYFYQLKINKNHIKLLKLVKFSVKHAYVAEMEEYEEVSVYVYKM